MCCKMQEGLEPVDSRFSFDKTDPDVLSAHYLVLEKYLKICTFN